MKISDRFYEKKDIISFSSTKGFFGGLSNMSNDYPLFVNEILIYNAESLYQSFKFSLFPSIQYKIINTSNPMEAKKISRHYNKYTRNDWEKIKIDIMRFVLKVKLIQNVKFYELLKKTGKKQIIEFSIKDDFWGAKNYNDKYLKGKNVLGRLLMELREKFILNNNKLDIVEPLDIPAFLLFNNEIINIYPVDYYIDDCDEYKNFKYVQ